MCHVLAYQHLQVVKEHFKNVFIWIITWKHFCCYTVFAWVPLTAEPQAERPCTIPLLKTTILRSRGERWIEWCKVKKRRIYPMVLSPVGQRFFPQGINSPEFPFCTWGETHHYRLVSVFHNLYKWTKVCVLFCLFFSLSIMILRYICVVAYIKSYARTYPNMTSTEPLYF